MIRHGQQIFRRFIFRLTAEKAQRVHPALALHAHEEPRGAFRDLQHIFLSGPKIGMSAPDMKDFPVLFPPFVGHDGHEAIVTVPFAVRVHGDHRRTFQPDLAKGGNGKFSLSVRAYMKHLFHSFHFL